MSNVIVVDDDPTNAGLIKMLLELDGYAVTSCNDIKQALQAATPEINVFVIDINLSRGENGLDILRAIRAGKTNSDPRATVIMTSGDYRREDESLAHNADLFLLKPYSPDILSNKIKEILGGDDHG